MADGEPDLRAAEEWFVAHGLPYFVDDLRAEVRRGLERPRLLRLLLVALVVGTAVGTGFGWWRGEHRTRRRCGVRRP